MGKIVSRFRFTLIELLVVITIIAILVSILLPALRNAKESSRRVVCAGNMRQLGFALFGYLNDNKEEFPVYYNVTDTPRYWFQKIQGYTNVELKWNSTDQQSIFHCLSNKAVYGSNTTTESGGTRYSVNYAYNVYLGSKYNAGEDWYAYKVLQVISPSRTASMADGAVYPSLVPKVLVSSYRIILDASGEMFLSEETQPGLIHSFGANILYIDNHIQYLKNKDFSSDMLKAR